MVRIATSVLIGLLFLTFKGRPVEASGRGGLAVTVTDSAGTPIKGARVVVSLPAGSAILEAQTSASGTAAFERLRAARYRVTVASPASMALAGDVLLGGTGELPGAEVTIRPGEVTRLERRLSPAGTIQVRLTRAGVPWLPDCDCRLQVSATDVFDPRTPDLDTTSLFVRGLPVRNDYRVLFEADGYATQEQVPVAVTGGQTTVVTFEYDPDNPTGLAGFVRDEQGAPVSGFQVVAYAEQPAPQGSPAGSSRSDANGRYSIVGLKPGGYRLHGFVGGSLAFGTVQMGSTTTLDVIARTSGGTASLQPAGWLQSKTRNVMWVCSVQRDARVPRSAAVSSRMVRKRDANERRRQN